MKLCLVCSGGGHLVELQQMKEVYSKYDHFFLTIENDYVKHVSAKEKMYFIKDPKRNPINFFTNLFQSLSVLVKEKPNIIITTGAGVAVPVCYLGKMLRKKIVYVESLSRIKEPSLSGRLVHPISDVFLVQWKPLLKKYKKAIYVGTVF